MSLIWVLLLVPAVLAGICPMENHQICNKASDKFRCTCSLVQEVEGSAPEQSCTNFINQEAQDDDQKSSDEDDDDSDEYDGQFPVVSVVFKLEGENADEFPEESFKDTISSSLRVEEEDIIILRATCLGTDDSLTVQFAILKKDVNETETQYEEDDFVDGESVATRMNSMGHLSQIADLDVENIEFTRKLVALEYKPDNSKLVYIAIGTGIAFFLMFVLGIWYGATHHDDYSDDLQKP